MRQTPDGDEVFVADYQNEFYGFLAPPSRLKAKRKTAARPGGDEGLLRCARA